MNTKILTLPGYCGSGSEHWQSYWESEYENIARVEQQNWEHPKLESWLETLNTTIQNCDENIILVAHSLGCSLVNHWANKYQSDKVLGVLLVAPADVDSAQHTPEEVRNFSPMPMKKLPFPSIVVTSDNDPYVSLERAKSFANTWDSRFVDIGSHGHINAESDLKSWGFGKSLVEELAQHKEV